MSGVHGRACVRALVLLLEGLQACRWSWFVFALNGCKPLASLVTVTKHVCAHIGACTLGLEESDFRSGGGGEGGGGLNHFSSYLSVTTALRLCRLVHKSDETRRGITRTSAWKITLLHFYRAA